MRIRKNAKLSPLLFSSSSSSSLGGSVPVETFQTHVCQLNQSPWDVIPFDSGSIQFEGAEDSFTNGSAGDSLGAVESVASLMDTEDNKPGIIEDVAMIALNDNHDINQHAKKVVVVNNSYKGLGKNSCCNAMDAKGWPCKNGVKHGQSFCHHHLSLLRSHNNNGSIKKTPATATATAAAATTTTGSRRARPRTAATKKGSGSSSNPNEFYYYSGFGPLWGKRRGDKNGEASKNSVGEDSTMLGLDNVNVKVVAADNVVVAANNDVVTSSEIDNVGFDFVDDDEDEDCDDDDDDVNGKKRMRKPVKERSLKSLM